MPEHPVVRRPTRSLRRHGRCRGLRAASSRAPSPAVSTTRSSPPSSSAPTSRSWSRFLVDPRSAGNPHRAARHRARLRVRAHGALSLGRVRDHGAPSATGSWGCASWVARAPGCGGGARSCAPSSAPRSRSGLFWCAVSRENRSVRTSCRTSVIHHWPVPPVVDSLSDVDQRSAPDPSPTRSSTRRQPRTARRRADLAPR